MSSLRTAHPIVRTVLHSLCPTLRFYRYFEMIVFTRDLFALLRMKITVHCSELIQVLGV